MSDQNVHLVRGFFETCNFRDLSKLTAVCSTGYKHHDPQLPVQNIDSLEHYQEVLGGFLAAFPDLNVTIEDIFAVGDRVGARWKFKGNHTRNLGDIPPTNKPVSVDAMVICRIANEKIDESWVVYDCMGMMQQMGIVPTPG